MKTGKLLPLIVALLCVAATAWGEDARPKGLAAECVACARSCPQRCVPKGGHCLCTANELSDCRNACDESAGSDAAALEHCRARCRTPASSR